MKPGFYFYELKSAYEYGTLIALVNPNGKVEKLYIGDHPLMINFVESSDWYKAENPNLSGWEYLGL